MKVSLRFIHFSGPVKGLYFSYLKRECCFFFLPPLLLPSRPCQSLLLIKGFCRDVELPKVKMAVIIGATRIFWISPFCSILWHAATERAFHQIIAASSSRSVVTLSKFICGTTVRWMGRKAPCRRAHSYRLINNEPKTLP